MPSFDAIAAAQPWVNGLAPCLRVPIAARDDNAIVDHVGSAAGRLPLYLLATKRFVAKEEETRVRRALEIYCARDTEALAALHRALVSAATRVETQ